MKNKLLITIVVNIIIIFIFPTYITYLNFGNLTFGKFYFDLTSFCGFVGFVFSLIYLNIKRDNNEK